MTVTFVLGGVRSGKSGYAQRQAETTGRPLVMIATAQALDAEMAERIAAHRAGRDSRWRTVEAPFALGAAIRALKPGEAAVADCLTLWLSNFLLAQAPLELETEAFLEALSATRADVWVVSNEVGMGIVPENALARRFRDDAGRLHQRVAERADRVITVMAGLPLSLKG